MLSRGATAGAGLDTKAWENFVGTLQQAFGCNRAEALNRFQTVVEDQLRWERAAALLAGPGHASIAYVRKALEDMDAKWTVEVAQLDAVAFAPVFADDLAKAQAYFNANAESYRIPARLTLRAVTFPAPAANPARPVTDEEVINHAYNFATELGIETGKVPEAVKARRTELEQRVRTRAATEESSARISDELAERFQGAKPTPAALEAWIQSKGGATRDLPAFDAGTDITMPGIPASAIDAASALGESSWHTDVYATSTGPILLLVKERTASRVPTFEEVKAKAVADWRLTERNRLFIVRATELGKSLASAVDQGKSFAEASKALGLAVLPSPAPFTAAETPAHLAGANLSTIAVLSETAVGKVASPLRITGGHFAFLRVVKREAPAIDVSSEKFRNVVSQVERMNARTTLLGQPAFGGFETEGASSKGLLDELTSDPNEIAPAAR